jgi:hypothetical protein
MEGLSGCTSDKTLQHLSKEKGVGVVDGRVEWPIQGRRRQAMDADFYFALALILFVFFLCFRFRKENRKK